MSRRACGLVLAAVAGPLFGEHGLVAGSPNECGEDGGSCPADVPKADIGSSAVQHAVARTRRHYTCDGQPSKDPTLGVYKEKDCPGYGCNAIPDTGKPDCRFCTIGKTPNEKILPPCDDMNNALYQADGCWKDDEKRAMEKRIDGFAGPMSGVQSIEECYELASAQGWPSFGVQYDVECWVGGNPKKYGRADKLEECKKGRGGNWTMSVYSIRNAPYKR